MKPRRLASLAVVLLALASARADVTLAVPFQDHVVLQRDLPLPVWGRADPGERVTVQFRGESVSTTAGKDGRWIVVLPSAPTSAEPETLTVVGNNTLTVQDVLVGEVWLCSGQSNMEWPVANSANAEEEIAAARFPLIRQLRIERTPASAPADTVPSTGWQTATPEYVGKFTAVGYFFAREIHRKLGVPVGLINSTWGGTPIESWMSPHALSDPAFAAVHTRFQAEAATFPERSARYPVERAAYLEAQAKAAATKTPNPVPWPVPPVGPGTAYEPSSLFNGMIAPLIPYAIRGALWYQGESNAPRPAEYRALFPALIESWRAHWGEGDFPFYFVQISSYLSNDFWPPLREAQTVALNLPHTGMVVTIDIGEPKNIHPRNKQEVGRRLALLAKTHLYGIPGDFSGPIFLSATREGRAMRVRFTHVSGGLVAYDKPVQSLQLAGADKVFHPATAVIQNGTLLVTSPEVKEPVAVRYAWENAPVANLYNGAGLPAAPFRSDDW